MSKDSNGNDASPPGTAKDSRSPKYEGNPDTSADPGIEYLPTADESPNQQHFQQEEDEGLQKIPMVLSRELQFPMESRVMLIHLQQKAKLNQQLGIVEEFLWNEGRYKVRPLSRKAKCMTKSRFVSVAPSCLVHVPPSAFVASLKDPRSKGATHRVPLECRVSWDLDDFYAVNNATSSTTANVAVPGESEGAPCSTTVALDCQPLLPQIKVEILYSDIWGTDCRNKLRDVFGHEANDPDVLAVLNTPIDFEEYVREDQFVEWDEILILYPKPFMGDLWDAMMDHELLLESETMLDVGMHGPLHLYRIAFPFMLPEPPPPPPKAPLTTNSDTLHTSTSAGQEVNPLPTTAASESLDASIAVGQDQPRNNMETTATSQDPSPPKRQKKEG